MNTKIQLFVFILLIICFSIGLSNEIKINDIPFKYQFIFQNILTEDFTFEEYESLEEIINITDIRKK